MTGATSGIGSTDDAPPTRRPELEPDCDRCCGLCCIAPPFFSGPDFAVDKAAGRRCPHLADDFRCGIHESLAEEGFRGCATYDCYGAGQKVTQTTFGGRDWRGDPEIATAMFEAFLVQRKLHELLLLLDEACRLEAAAPLLARLEVTRREVEVVTLGSPEQLAELDFPRLHGEVHGLLREIGRLVATDPRRRGR